MTTSSSPLRRRHRAFLGMLGLALAGIAAGAMGTLWLKSPQQVAADAAAPPPTMLTASVESRVLAESVVTRGTVKPSSSFEVTPSAAAGGSGGGTAVVTAVRVTVGGTVDAAQVLVEVSGRPLFALPGAVPAYRDLRPGASGEDVTQLQAALTTLGIDPHESGTFGAGTKAAVTALYAKLGYPAPTTGEQDSQALDSANRAVTTATRAVDVARDTLNRLRAAPPAEPATPGEPDPIQAAETTLTHATEDHATAVAERDRLLATTGPMVPVSELVVLPAFPARVEAMKAAVGATVAAPMITLSSGQLMVRGTVTPAQRPLLKPGLPVDLAAEATGATAHGTIDSIGELQTDTAGGAHSHALSVVSDRGPLDPALAGQDVRITVTTAASDGPVLAVPVSALSAGADGTTAVRRRDPDGSVARVAVTAGMSAAGYVAVTPVDGSLRAGDQVVTGVTPNSGKSGPVATGPAR